MLPKSLIDLIKKKRLDGESLSSIAEHLRLSKATVQFVVKNNYNKKKKKTGPKRKLNKAALLRMKRQVEMINQSGCKVSSRKIKNECELNVSLRTVQRSLKSLGYIYKKASQEIMLTQQHKMQRVILCKEWLTDRLDFKKVVFTDEKRFHLDGPDGWWSY